jgi:type III pantothenate kinase
MLAAGEIATRIVVDIGNSRIKWGLLDEVGQIHLRRAWPVEDDAVEWREALSEWGGSTRVAWAISSVNPPVAETFGRWLDSMAPSDVTWYRSAEEVPLAMRVRESSRAGADRALAVLAARAIDGSDGPGLVVSCGTALTIERIDASGVWEGGAIAAGLRAVSDAMRQSTAQLPQIEPDHEVSSWGDTTESAMKAGAFWGTVGALRELIARQGLDRWRIWTGGNASLLAPLVEGESIIPRIVPDLVLRGLAMAAFGVSAEAMGHE